MRHDGAEGYAGLEGMDRFHATAVFIAGDFSRRGFQSRCRSSPNLS